VKMAGYQQRSSRYPSLRITVKHETEERSVTEIYSNPRMYQHPTTVFYNSNHRQKQYFNRPSTIQRRSQKYHHFHYHNQQQPIRPLMEIQDFNDHSYSYSFKQKEPKQRGQYRNRKVELDWDHAFDLDQIDLYTGQNDIDIDSLISLNSSSDNSFSSV